MAVDLKVGYAYVIQSSSTSPNSSLGVDFDCSIILDNLDLLIASCSHGLVATELVLGALSFIYSLVRFKTIKLYVVYMQPFSASHSECPITGSVAFVRVARDCSLSKCSLSDQGTSFDAPGHALWSPSLLWELLEHSRITPGAFLISDQDDISLRQAHLYT